MNNRKKYVYICSIGCLCLVTALLAEPILKVLTSREMVSLILLLETF